MSGGDENFLARWSRRKQAVERAEQSEAVGKTEGGGPAPPPFTGEGDHAQHSGGGDHERRGRLLPPPPASPDPLPRSAGEEPAADASGPEQPPLPRIEELTAESDISAFLRAGVPPALKTAALRRTWSLDPAIRDYVGPSEYAHDFNNPASIPGFGSGPGWDAGTAAEYAQRLVNPSDIGGAEQTANPGADRPAQPELDPVRQAGTAAPPQATEAPPADRTGAPDVDASREASAASDDALPREGVPPPPRHGGALPR